MRAVISTAPSWPAPLAPGPMSWRQRVPGSKSMTNRALVLAALAESPSRIVGALRSRDTDLMMAALAGLGVGIEVEDHGSVVVTPGPLHAADIDCGLAGTVMRFLPAVAALGRGAIRFDGDPQARVRPMAALLDALRSAGVRVDGSALPFTVHGAGSVPGGTIDVDASGSSQFVSGLLLAGARFDDGLVLRHRGETLPSQPHIDMTVAMLAEAGVAVEYSRGASAPTWRVPAGRIAGRRWEIEPDLSNAAPFLAAAAVAGGTVSVADWPYSTTQPGADIRDILEQMGCTVAFEQPTEDIAAAAAPAPREGSRGPHSAERAELRVTGPVGGLGGIDISMAACGELVPTVAALAAVAAHGGARSRITGVAHLRGHETDRLRALTAEITALGGRCRELPDGLVIEPAPLHGGLWHSYADHRMATAGAIIGLAVPGVLVDDIDTTTKTLPGFAGMWAAMLDGAERPGKHR